jgi:hypothetical protein
VVHETLSLIIHAQYAVSHAMQTLSSFLYLRKSLNRVPPITAHHIDLLSILSKLLWASSIWWSSSHSIRYPLQLIYHRIAYLIAGRLPSTSVAKLLYCANLPLLISG